MAQKYGKTSSSGIRRDMSINANSTLIGYDHIVKSMA